MYRDIRYRLGLNYEPLYAVMSLDSYADLLKSLAPWTFQNNLDESEEKFAGIRILRSKHLKSGFEICYTQEDLESSHPIETLIGY